MHKPDPTTTRAELLGVYAIVGIFAIAIITVVGWFWAGSKREDVAQWIMAGASVTTLIAAVGAAVFAAGAYDVETRREKRALDAEEKSQAERVAAWAEVDRVVIADHGESLAVHWSLVTRNASDLPVYGMDIEATCLVKMPGRIRSRKVEKYVGLLPPGTNRVSPDPIQIRLSAKQRALDIFEQDSLAAMSRATIFIEVTFRDAGDRAWRRDSSGVLSGPFDVKEWDDVP